MSNEQNDVQHLKIITIGESACGKTSLLKALSGDEFNQNIQSSMGIDYFFLKYRHFGNELNIRFIDTAGQE
jgi:GTPase SAR1 family protein